MSAFVKVANILICRNSSLRTPLGCAAAAGHIKVCKLLVNADAMINVDDKIGVSAKQKYKVANNQTASYPKWL